MMEHVIGGRCWVFWTDREGERDEFIWQPRKDRDGEEEVKVEGGRRRR